MRRTTPWALALALATPPAAADEVLELPVHLRIDRIVVHKAQRQMQLMVGTHPVRTYPIQLGRAPVGQKIAEGDARTPEGVFHITKRNENSQYYRSLRLSYPRKEDLERARINGARPGGDIMIHGVPPEADRRSVLMFDGPDWTDGCVAVTNVHMREIWKLIAVGTRVEIYP